MNRSANRPSSICALAASIAALSSLSGCATVVEGHERALFYSARTGLSREPVGSGWYWHWPWNDFITYDLRWSSHKEEIHIHSKDGLHMNIDVAVVVRPDARDIYALDTEVGPAFYDGVVKAALFAAVRDASGKFDHMQIATEHARGRARDLQRARSSTSRASTSSCRRSRSSTSTCRPTSSWPPTARRASGSW